MPIVDGPTKGGVLLEYVTTPDCVDCRVLERMLGRVLRDYPWVEAVEVPRDSMRGLELTVARGILRFPVIVVDGEIVGVESISEADLRAALQRGG